MSVTGRSRLAGDAERINFRLKSKTQNKYYDFKTGDLKVVHVINKSVHDVNLKTLR